MIGAPAVTVPETVMTTGLSGVPPAMVTAPVMEPVHVWLSDMTPSVTTSAASGSAGKASALNS